MKLKPNKHRHIYMLLNRLHLQEDKEGLVMQFSNQRTTHVGELTQGEANALITHLSRGLSEDSPAKKANKMRKKILSMCHEMGWDNPDTGKINMHRVNAFCKKQGYLHKGLNEHTLQELPTLVTQFEKVYEHYLNAVR